MTEGVELAQLLKELDESLSGEAPRLIGDLEPDFLDGRFAAYSLGNAGLQEWVDKPVEWLIEGVLPAGTNAVAGGPEKTLKSKMVTVDMTIALASGRPWLGQFTVPEPSKVLVIANEALRPILHDQLLMADQATRDNAAIANGVGMTFRTVTDHAQGMIDSGAFAPDVVIWDAAYGYIDGRAKAENLFSMGDELDVVKDFGLRNGSAQIIVHHFNAQGRAGGTPELRHLTFAGFQEWTDSWVLLCHRDEADPETGTFKLGMVVGTRQANSSAHEVDVWVDVDLNNETPPRFECEQVTFAQSKQWGSKSKGQTDLEKQARRQAVKQVIVEWLLTDPYTMTKGDITKLDGVGERIGGEVLREMANCGDIRLVRLPMQRGSRTMRVEVWGISPNVRGKYLAGQVVPEDYPNPPNETLL